MEISEAIFYVKMIGDRQQDLATETGDTYHINRAEAVRTVLGALEAADRLSYERGQVDGYKAGRRDGVQASLDALHQLKQLEEAYERQDYTAYCVSVDSNLG